MTLRVQIAFLMYIFCNSVFAEKILVRVQKDSFPATYMKGDKWAGMDVDIVRELFAEAQLEYGFVEIPFQRSLIKIKEGDIHLITNLEKNEARSDYMNWLGPMRITCIGLVVQEKDQPLLIKTIDDLITIAAEQNKKIGYLRGASYSPFLDARLQNDALLNDVLYFLSDNLHHREMLKLDRLLGYFYDAFEIQKRMSDPRFSHEYEGLVLHSYRIEDSCSGAYIGISKTLDAGTYQKIVNAFQAIKDEGTLSDIHLKWVGTEAEKEKKWDAFIKAK